MNPAINLWQERTKESAHLATADEIILFNANFAETRFSEHLHSVEIHDEGVRGNVRTVSRVG